MKRILVFALAAVAFTACDNKNTSETTVTNTDSASMTTNMGNDTAVVTDNTTTTMSGDAMTSNRYVPAEGDVMYRDKKLMVWRNGAYVQADNDVTVDNGVTVRRNGEVRRSDGEVVVLKDGQTYSRTGRFFNSAGEAIEDGWDATKKGVKKAGQAIKKGANKIGEEVKDAVN